MRSIHAFDVFGEGTEAQVHVHGRALCGEQPAPFFGIRGGAFSGEPRQRFVSDLPVTGSLCSVPMSSASMPST